MKAQIELVGILHIVYSSIGILIAIACFVLFSGIGWISGDATAMGVLGITGLLIAIVLGIVSIPGMIAGIGLLKLKSWSRILAIVVGCLYVLMNDEAIRLLSGGPQAQATVPTPA
jgi:hypothetical protein